MRQMEARCSAENIASLLRANDGTLVDSEDHSSRSGFSGFRESTPVSIQSSGYSFKRRGCSKIRLQYSGTRPRVENRGLVGPVSR